MRQVSAVLLAALLWTPVAGTSSQQSSDGYSCVGLSAPIDGSVTRSFGPIGRYGGHWGIDYETMAVGAHVVSAASGTVTFAGVVVGNRAVTVDHGGGLKTSYSYLGEALVDRGDWVRRGDRIGVGAVPRDHATVHFSVRVHESYVDPEPLVGCVRRPPSAGLSLISLP